MKITEVRLVPLRVVRDVGTLEPAWESGASMRFSRGGGAVVEVVTDEGLVGIGPAAKGRVLEAAQATIVGEDPRDVEGLFERMRFAMRNQGGMAAVDIALWDLRARIEGVPLYRLCGGGRDRVPAYASMIQLGDPQERAALAQQLQRDGFHAIKLRLHAATMREDLAIVEAVRAAVGDRMTILCDANQAQSQGEWQPGVRWDFARAKATAIELERLSVAWLEEPLPRHAFLELRRLRDEVAIDIAGGENLRLQEYAPMLAMGPYDIVQPDAMVVDGLTGLRRVFAMARQSGVRIAPHHGGRGLGTIAHLHACASAPDVPFVEVLHDPPIGDFAHGFAPFVSAPTLDGNGCLVLPGGAGLGVTVDPEFRGRTD
jgi:hypothetical protein